MGSCLARLGFASAVALLAVAAARPAQASPFDVFGFGPEAVGEVSARAARAQDGTATFYNPGGLAFGKGYGVQVAGLAGISGLSVQGGRQSIASPVGATVAIDLDVPLEGPLAGRVRLGAGLFLLPSTMMHLRVRETTTPFFPYYDNRTQRFTAIPALSIRPFDKLGIGVGVNVLAGVTGPVDVREGQSRGLESRVETESKTEASLVAGVRFDATPRLHFGATFRQRFGVPVKVTTTSNIAGVPLMVDVSTAQTLYDPMTVVLAAGLDASDNLTFEVDAGYHRWSAWSGPLLTIDTTVSALTLSSHPPTNLFKDSFSGRGAAAWRVMHDARKEFKLHLGAGYETSMLRSDVQQGRSNMVDGDKLLIGVGGTGMWRGVVGKALRVGAGVQVQRVGSYSQDKIACTKVPCPADTVVGPETATPDQGITNPGYPNLHSSGMVYVVSVGLGVDL